MNAIWACESCQHHHFLAKELPLILSGGWYYSHARDLQDGITACCPIANNLSKMAGCCWVQRTMNTSFLVSRGAQQAAHWMTGYILDQCEWTWTPSVCLCQLLGCWAKLCSLRRGACPGCILLQFQRPQVLLLLQLLQHCLLQTGKISLADVLSPAQRRRAARCWALWEPGDRQQWWQEHGGRGHIVTLSARCSSELNGECMGWWVQEMPVVAKAAEEMLQMMCSVKHWGTCSVPDSFNLDYCTHVQFGKDLSRILCCHHKCQEWIWFSKQLLLRSRTTSSVNFLCVCVRVNNFYTITDLIFFLCESWHRDNKNNLTWYS